MATPSLFNMKETPPLIKYISLAIAVISVFSAAIQSIFNQFSLSFGPQIILSLSSWGTSQGFIWQLFSYLFIQETFDGLSLSFFTSLFLNVYFFFVIAPLVLDSIGKGPFIRLCLVCGLLSGFFVILFMKLNGIDHLIAGCTSVTLSLMLIWSMAYPDEEILLVSLIPIKIKWLSVITIGMFLLSTLSRWDLPLFILYLSSALIAYCYATMAWGWKSPFAWTSPIDKTLSAIGSSIRQFMIKAFHLKIDPKAKIVDIQTGQKPMEDKAFVEQALNKIYKGGLESLSWNERKRLNEITKNKKK